MTLWSSRRDVMEALRKLTFIT